MSVITGEAVHAVRDMEDKEVVDECMKVLRELFKEQVTRVRVCVSLSHSADMYCFLTSTTVG